MMVLSRANARLPRKGKAQVLSPSKLLLALEGRALLELASVPLATPCLLRHVPCGDGHAVLVIPGFLASDLSTAPLRRFLRHRGYNVCGWGQGRNCGPRAGVVDRLLQQLEELHASSGGKVSLIGWSLGGIFAREIARSRPHLVRQVITLGSPLYGEPETSTNVWGLYQRLNGPGEHGAMRGDKAPPVPTTSIFSRGDGIVAWEASLEWRGAHIDNVEVHRASHLGLGVNPFVWFVLGDRLAQDEVEWVPFRTTGLRRLLFSSHQSCEPTDRKS